MAGPRWDERAPVKESLCRFWRAFEGRANRGWSGPGCSRSTIQAQEGWPKEAGQLEERGYHCPPHLWVGYEYDIDFFTMEDARAS